MSDCSDCAACRHRLPTALPAARRHRLHCRLEAALACRRFAAAACDPELLREVDAGQLEGLWALRSLAAWLVRHGRHVRRLSLACYAEHLLADCAAALASCLVAADAAGKLEQVKVSGRVGSTEWVAALRSLQHLQRAGYRRRTLDFSEGGDGGASSALIGALPHLTGLTCLVSHEPD